MVQWDHEIEHRNPDILVVDVAFPAYRKVSDKEWKKKKVGKTTSGGKSPMVNEKVDVIPIVVGA